MRWRLCVISGRGRYGHKNLICHQGRCGDLCEKQNANLKEFFRGSVRELNGGAG